MQINLHQGTMSHTSKELQDHPEERCKFMCYRFDGKIGSMEKVGRHDSVMAKDFDFVSSSDIEDSDHDGGSEASSLQSLTDGLPIQNWSSPLDGSNEGEGKIVFSPCSTAPSTPGLGNDKFLGEEFVLSPRLAESHSQVAIIVASF